MEELHEVICWFMGYSEEVLIVIIASDMHFMDFFAGATLNPNADKITKIIYGVRVETVEDPLMQKIRMLDKLVDELAKGRAMSKVLRG